MWIPDPRFEEPNLLVPSKKPIGEMAIDWGNPIAKELKLFQLKMLSDSAINLVTGSINGPDSNAPTLAGNALRFNSPTRNAEALVLELDDVDIGGLSSVTYIIHCKFLGPSDALHDPLGGGWSQRQNSFAPPEQLLIWYQTSTGSLLGYVNPGSTAVASGTVSLLDDKFHAVGIKYGGGELSVWADGRKIGSVAKTGAIRSSNGFKFESPGGHRATGTPGAGRDRPPRIDMLSSMLWYRNLSDAEMSAMTKNPYQFLIPA